MLVERRTVRALLALVTMIASSGLAAGGTAGSLLGAEMAGTDALAGLPLGLLVMGSGAMALIMTRLVSRIGWGRSLMLGYILGATGAMLVMGAAAASSFSGLLMGSVLLGAANASVFLTRYAAAALAGEAEKGRALGTIFFATAIGAVASPGLLGPSGALAHAVGLPRLSGLYVVAVASFATAALLLALMSHPAVPYVGRGAALLGPGSSVPVTRHEIASGLKASPAKAALTILAVTNFAMVAIMTIAPVHLAAMSHDLQLSGVIVSLHVAGMFVLSPITGWLADRAGPMTIAVAGLSLLLVSCGVGVLVGQPTTFSMAMMLIILGMGWNCGVVGASALLASSVLPTLRPHVEGIGEATMSLAAAVGAPIAGIITALAGLPALSLAGATVVMLTLVFVRPPLQQHAKPVMP